jgi:hypothetical protein
MFAFFGMESALQVSGEVVDAQRTVPRAIALGLLGVALLYVSVQLSPRECWGARWQHRKRRKRRSRQPRSSSPERPARGSF